MKDLLGFGGDEGLFLGGSRDQDCRGIVGFCGGLEFRFREGGDMVGFGGAYELLPKGGGLRVQELWGFRV